MLGNLVTVPFIYTSMCQEMLTVYSDQSQSLFFILSMCFVGLFILIDLLERKSLE